MALDPLIEEINTLSERVKKAQFPEDLTLQVKRQIERLRRIAKSEGFSLEYDKTENYIDWIMNLPWNKKSLEDIDLTKVQQIFDKNHFGLENLKERIIEYLSVLKLHAQRKQEGKKIPAPIICLVGLVGTGKTTFAYSLAEAINRPFARIPFGGMGAARDLRGQSRQHEEAEPGYVIKAMRRAKVKNPILLLDEIDRVTEEARADVMGVLVELLDPEQNYAFVDHYLDYPFDLSEVIFVATANNTSNIATAVMDRLEPISMPAYSDNEKIHIGRDYLLPRAMEEAGLTPGQIEIDDTIWPKIVRPLGFDAGIRTLQRTIKGITRKVAKQMVEGNMNLVHLTAENIANYLPSD